MRARSKLVGKLSAAVVATLAPVIALSGCPNNLIAANQLDFRFELNRTDEIGVVEESFNSITARNQANRDESRGTVKYLGGIH